MALTELYLKAGKTDEAETAMRDAVAAMPDDWGMKRKLVEFLADKRGVDAAEKEIRGYMQTDPKNEQLPFWLANLYLTHGQPEKAITLLQQIAAPDRFDAQGLNARALLARIALVQNRMADAQSLATLVLEKDPNNSEALFVRASFAYQNGQYQNAVTDLRTVVRNDPSAREAYPLLAESLLLQGIWTSRLKR